MRRQTGDETMRSTTMMRGAFAMAALLVAGQAAAQRTDEDWLRSCRDNRWNRRVTYCEVRQSSMPAPGGTLTIDGRENGGVEVRGWDGGEVRVTARVQASDHSESEARSLASQVRVNAGGGTIRAEGPTGLRDRSWSVSYVVMVPRRSDLSVQTTNGGIAIHDVAGRMELSATNGPLSLQGVGGDVRGRTVNGPVRVRLDGTRWQGAGLDVSTTNGPVTLAVSQGFAAHLDAGNTNGPVNVGFPITVTGRVGHHIETDLNGGGPTIRARTVNGPFSLERI
jgi:hypothetical protein